MIEQFRGALHDAIELYEAHYTSNNPMHWRRYLDVHALKRIIDDPHNSIASLHQQVTDFLLSMPYICLGYVTQYRNFPKQFSYLKWYVQDVLDFPYFRLENLQKFYAQQLKDKLELQQIAQASYAELEQQRNEELLTAIQSLSDQVQQLREENAQLQHIIHEQAKLINDHVPMTSIDVGDLCEHQSSNSNDSNENKQLMQTKLQSTRQPFFKMGAIDDNCDMQLTFPISKNTMR